MIEITLTFDRFEDGIAVYKLEMPTENQIAKRKIEEAIVGCNIVNEFSLITLSVVKDWLDKDGE